MNFHFKNSWTAKALLTIATSIVVILIINQAQAKSLKKDEVYSSLDGKLAIEVISANELEIYIGGDIILANYNFKDGKLRIVYTVLGTKKVKYYEIIEEGLRDRNGKILFSKVAIQKAKAAKLKAEAEAKAAKLKAEAEVSYLIQIYKLEIAYQIQKNWAFSEQLAGMRNDLKALLVFKVMPDGEIRDVFFTDRSGNRYLDESAHKAIIKSNPILPHPKGVIRPYVTVGIRFTPEGAK
jgi:TonB family protein